MVNKKNTKILVIILVVFLVAVVAGTRYIYQDHRDIKAEPADYKLSSEKLIGSFINTPLEAEKPYLNKTLEVTGIVSETDHQNLVLNDKIFCQFQNTLTKVGLNDSITIKGRFIGYDELLEEIKLDQCTTINN